MSTARSSAPTSSTWRRTSTAAADLAQRRRPGAFQQFLIAQAGLRDLPAAYVVDARACRSCTRSRTRNSPTSFRRPRRSAQAEAGQVALSTADGRLPRRGGRQAAQLSGPLSLRGARREPEGRRASSPYRAERRRISSGCGKRECGLKVAHGLMYFMISMTALLAAIWVGMWFAGRFVAPIRRLIAAAQQVSQGNLKIELPEKRGEGDLRRLSHTFNTMTRELKRQQRRPRHCQTPSFPSGAASWRRCCRACRPASSGSIAATASRSLSRSARDACSGLRRCRSSSASRLADAVPEFARPARLASRTELKSKKPARRSTTVARRRGARLRREGDAREGERGRLSARSLTFDDVTELVTAQRTSAWADVARRIAHEIKNPLTPIQLSAERLRRKYGKHDHRGPRDCSRR